MSTWNQDERYRSCFQTEGHKKFKRKTCIYIKCRSVESWQWNHWHLGRAQLMTRMKELNYIYDWMKILPMAKLGMSRACTNLQVIKYMPQLIRQLVDQLLFSHFEGGSGGRTLPIIMQVNLNPLDGSGMGWLYGTVNLNCRQNFGKSAEKSSPFCHPANELVRKACRFISFSPGELISLKGKKLSMVKIDINQTPNQPLVLKAQNLISTPQNLGREENKLVFASDNWKLNHS